MKIFTLLVSFNLFFTGFCYSLNDGRAEVTKGHDRLAVVRFPSPWIQPDSRGGETAITMPSQYAIRQSKNSSSNELLITRKWSSSSDDEKTEWIDDNLKIQQYVAPLNLVEGSFSEDIYAVSLDNKFQIRRATLDEWNASNQVTKSRHRLPLSRQGQSPDGIEYEGRLYAKTGRFWGTVGGLLSPDKKWLIVFSYTAEKEREPPRLPGQSYSGPSEGQMFVDVYNISTGDKVQAANASFTKTSPSLYFSNALWIDSNCFIMPIDGFAQTCLIGILGN